MILESFSSSKTSPLALDAGVDGGVVADDVRCDSVVPHSLQKAHGALPLPTLAARRNGGVVAHLGGVSADRRLASRGKNKTKAKEHTTRVKSSNY